MITEGGCLLHDREYAMVDSDGNFIIGKTNPLVHLLRSAIDFEKELISFRHEHGTEWQQFHLQKERQAINNYLGSFFDTGVTLEQNSQGRFLDIPDTSGITILSTASLETVSGWYNHIDLNETRRRFRATIEIEGVPPFWEDNLFSELGTAIEFKTGDVILFGMSPRARCVVPTRDTLSGEVTAAFPKTFARHRAETLPAWSGLKEYGHYFHLTVNCYIPPAGIGKWIQVGDEVTIVGKKAF
jgi:uncharacterized protein YcbX